MKIEKYEKSKKKTFFQLKIEKSVKSKKSSFFLRFFIFFDFHIFKNQKNIEGFLKISKHFFFRKNLFPKTFFEEKNRKSSIWLLSENKASIHGWGQTIKPLRIRVSSSVKLKSGVTSTPPPPRPDWVKENKA